MTPDPPTLRPPVTPDPPTLRPPVTPGPPTLRPPPVHPRPAPTDPAAQQRYGAMVAGGAVAAPAGPAAATTVTTEPPAQDDPTTALRAPGAAAEGVAMAPALAATVMPAALPLARAAGDGEAPGGAVVHHGLPPDQPDPGLKGRLRRLRIGSHRASRSALARLGLAGPGTGLLLGVDPHRRPVAARLFRPEPTRVALVGSVWATQLLVFRAFAVGARVVVVSDNPQHWLSFAQHATGRADRLLALGPQGLAPGGAGHPTLVIDDRGHAATAFAAALGPWQTQVTVLAHLDQLGTILLQEYDLAVLQRLGSVEATVIAHALRLPRQSQQSLQGLPDDVLALVAGGVETYVNVSQTDLERSYVGEPRPRAIDASMPVAEGFRTDTVVLGGDAAAPVTTGPPATQPPTPAWPAPVPRTMPSPPPPPEPAPVMVAALPPVSVPPVPPVPPTAIAPWPGAVAPPAPVRLAPPAPAPVYEGWPPAPSSARVPSADLDADDEDDVLAPDRRRRERMLLTGVGVIAALALAGWAAGFVFSGTTPRVAPTDRPPPSAGATSPQVVVRPLPVPTITAAAEAGGIRFSWTYDDPQPGDFFRIRRTDEEDARPRDIFEQSVVIADERACLEVRIFRAGGQGGAAEVSCFR